MLDRVLTQTEFANLVGISQPAVSDLLTRNILRPGQTGATWLLRYTNHLREQAAGRGADGELAANRAAESATRNDLLQIKLKKARGEFAGVDVISQVLAYIGSQIASKLEPLPARIKMLCPDMLPDDVKAVESAITEARNLAVAASLAMLAEAAKDEDDEVSDKVSST